MKDFNLALFWSLPSCEEALCDGEGNYCALGAAGAALGVPDEEIIQEDKFDADKPSFLLDYLTPEEMHDIYLVNDKGITYTEWKRNSFKTNESPNPKLAKTMLLKKLAGKVNFINGEYVHE